MEWVTLTNDMINAGRTYQPCGGWNNRQLAVLGVDPRDNSGWKRKLIGTVVSKSQYERFLALKTVKDTVKQGELFAEDSSQIAPPK